MEEFKDMSKEEFIKRFAIPLNLTASLIITKMRPTLMRQLKKAVVLKDLTTVHPIAMVVGSLNIHAYLSI